MNERQENVEAERLFLVCLLNTEARGKGYAIEASAAMIRWVAQQAGVISVSATVPDDNYPSQRVAARLGLVRTNETRRDLPLWKSALR